MAKNLDKFEDFRSVIAMNSVEYTSGSLSFNKALKATSSSVYGKRVEGLNWLTQKWETV